MRLPRRSAPRNDVRGTTHLPSFMLFSCAQRFFPTNPLAPVTRIFILLRSDVTCFSAWDETEVFLDEAEA